MCQIIKTKFFCKTTFSTGSGGHGVIPSERKPRFISGNWYDGEYETWHSKKLTQEEYYKMNNGWRSYWVTDENGKKDEINRTYMSMIFELNIVEVRDQKIKEILKDSNSN